MLISAKNCFYVESPFNTNTAFETIPFRSLNNTEKVICFVRERGTFFQIFSAIILMIKHVLME